MGSRSIESAIGGLGDGSGPVGLDIKIIEGAEYITGGLFDSHSYTRDISHVVTSFLACSGVYLL